MGNKIMLSIFVFSIIVLLCGCSSNSSSGEKELEKEEEKVFSSLDGNVWQDNSLDVYSATFLQPIKFTEQENAIFGGAEQYVLGKEKAIVFKKHLFQDVNSCWDELKFYDQEKKEESHRLEFEKNQLNQAWVVGSVYDSDHCILLNV